MTVEPISLPRLAIGFIPAMAVVALMWRFRAGGAKAVYAFARMLAQLMLAGYALVFIFSAHSPPIVLAVMGVMALASSWIALNTVRTGKAALLRASLLSILFGGGVTLLFVVGGVLALEPWYAPNIVVPLTGMVFASSMTAISIAAERLEAESRGGAGLDAARRAAFQGAMIPNMNALFAVGLVSMPGMMTGQILSGVSPLVAVRYQIMVMAMLFAAAGLSTALFIYLSRNAKAFGAKASKAPEKTLKEM